MKLPIFLSVSALVTSSFLVACTSTTPDSSSSAAPASDVIPELDVSASTLNCSIEYPDDEYVTIIRQTADVMAGDVKYRVATLGCGLPASEIGPEVVEAFVFENGAWTSVGLVSGSGERFNTSGACASDNTTITCPAYTGGYGEDGKSGRIEITQQGSGLVWTFVAE